MALTRGNVDTLDQTQIRELSGGTAATKFITTDNSTRTAGNLLMTDAHGNAVDAGVSASTIFGSSSAATPILDSATGAPILTASGDWIFPG